MSGASSGRIGRTGRRVPSLRAISPSSSTGYLLFPVDGVAHILAGFFDAAGGLVLNSVDTARPTKSANRRTLLRSAPAQDHRPRGSSDPPDGSGVHLRRLL